MLPGLAPGGARAAEGDELTFQYGQYQEDERDLVDAKSDYDPIRADTLLFHQRLTPADRWRLDLTYMQDTWSGATPVTTAPLVLGGNHPTSPDGVSGATPLVEGDLFLDGNLQPVAVNEFGEVVATDPRLVHTMSSASPETRMQGQFELGYDWSGVELDFGAGLSYEDDYESRFASAGASWELDQSRTSFDLVLRFADNETQALLDPDAVPYIDTRAYQGEIDVSGSGERTLDDDRQDWSAALGATQILSKNARVESSVAYARSRGYLANPYKVVEVGFIDPAQQFLAPPGGYYAQVRALLEKRPSLRSLWTWDTRFVQYVEPFGASLHLGYRLYHDDWGIDAHTLEASWAQPLGAGWTAIPRVRYYSQSEADFYAPYLISDQAFVSVVSDPDTGEIISVTPYDPALLPSSYSSDQRLSGFGALSGGLTLVKQFARGVRLEADFEYYAHRGDLRLGGGGEADYADWDSYRFSASVTLDANALQAFGYRSTSGRDGHGDHRAHAGERAPAGVLLAHMLPDAGQFGLGYRYVLGRQAGDLLHGASSVSDAQVIALGCEGDPCSTAPRRMDMQMHMLEWMYAPTDWLNVMLMAQFVDMKMDVQPLAGPMPDLHGAHDHSTGGPGDTLGFLLFELAETETQSLHFGLGISAPTGDVGEKQRRTHQEDVGYVHYGMQLGSGTWDLLPSLTWTGSLDRFQLGGQVSGARRLESENRSGYALGDAFQVTAWAGYSPLDWLSVSLRGVYSMQGELRGEYDGLHADSGPMDFPDNYGGQYWDVGLGLSAVLPDGYLAGNRFAVEWLEPVHDDANGYQLERTGTLFVNWSVDF